MNSTPINQNIKIKEIFDKLINHGYTFDITTKSCMVYRFEEPIFGMSNLNDPSDPDERNGILAHWHAALGAALAHQHFYPNQTPRLYPGYNC